MAKIELKKPVVEEISANIEGAQSVVLVQYCGLTVEQDTRLRKELRDNGIVYKVYKNGPRSATLPANPFRRSFSFFNRPSTDL